MHEKEENHDNNKNIVLAKVFRVLNTKGIRHKSVVLVTDIEPMCSLFFHISFKCSS